MSKFWSLKKNENSAELLIYGEISDMSYWGDEVIPKDIDAELKAMGDVSEIIVRINSPGGGVWAGIAIHTMLTRHKATKTVYVDGMAASIASIIAMAGDKIIMANGTMMMVHNPLTIAMGNANEFRTVADRLDSVRNAMLSIYTNKTGKTDGEIIALLDAETFMTAEEAVLEGFAHEVEKGAKVAACMRGDKAIINGIEMDLSKFKNAPKLPEEQPDNRRSTNGDAAALWIEIESLKAQLAAKSTQTPPEPEVIPAIVATGRNIDLEIKSLELYQNQI